MSNQLRAFIGFGAVALCLAIVASHGHLAAQGASRKPDIHFTVYGVGTTSCGSWKAAKIDGDKTRRLVFETWVAGYVSGATLMATGLDGAKFRETDPSGLSAWIDDYCASHPLEAISDASMSLIGELRQK